MTKLRAKGQRNMRVAAALALGFSLDAALGFNSAFVFRSQQHRHQHQQHRWVTAPRTILEAKPYILGLAENQEEQSRGEADFEEALGTLVFSSVDPMLDIARNIETYDEEFVTWVKAKADNSDDMEEREALNSLAAMVVETRDKFFAVVDAETAEEAQAAMGGEAGSAEGNPNLDTFGDVPMARLDASGNAVMADGSSAAAAAAGEGGDKAVIDAMRSMQFGGSELDEQRAQAAKAAAEAAEAAEAEALKTYQTLLGVLVTAEDLQATVKEKYYECDYKFLETCESVKKKALEEGDEEGAAKVSAVLEAIQREAAKQIEDATAILGQVLNAGGPGLMESEMAKLCKQGKVGDAVLSLLEANIQAAEAAGAAEPAAVMTKLKERAQLELDKLKDPEQRLLSQLLRTESAEKRTELLTKAFTPVQSLLVDVAGGAGGAGDEGQQEAMPEVTPPAFIEIIQTMIQNFGNLALPPDAVGEGSKESLQERLLKIAVEAEQVSVSIFGESMSPEEQQDRMWADGTVSVWDLETMEQQAEVMGEEMPWHGEMDENLFLEKMQQNEKKNMGFDANGVKKIGGG